MTCALPISHENIRPGYDQIISCPALGGQICLRCCLRVRQLLDERNQPCYIEPGMSNDALLATMDDYKASLRERLPSHLLEFYDIVPKVSKKTLDRINQDCTACHAGENKPIYPDNAVSANEGWR